MSWSQYAAAWASQHGGYDPRRAPSWPRRWHWVGYHAGRMLAGLRVPPGLLTAVSLAVAAAMAYAAARGPVGALVAAALMALSALAAMLARALGLLYGYVSSWTVIRESVADRLAEVCFLIGFWRAGVPAVLVVTCGVSVGLHEYIREQALGAGVIPAAAQSVGERPTRLAVAAAGLALASFTGDLAPGVLTLAIAGCVLFTVLGLNQLVTAVRQSIPVPPRRT